MLTGCVQSVFFPRVNAATARVLAAEGCDVIIPRSQGCCGRAVAWEISTFQYTGAGSQRDTNRAGTHSRSSRDACCYDRRR